MLARTVIALSLVVRVYDNAGVARADLHTALRAAQAILENAGIAVTWRGDLEADSGQDGQDRRDGQDPPPLAPAELIVRIVDAPPTSVAGSLGYSFVDVGRGAGTLATVFADRVNALATVAGANRSQLLGRAIAHEIGHLLIGHTRHADRGLMRGVWTTIDLQKDRPWDWVLSRKDGDQMRRGLAARLRRAETPAAVVARK